MKDIALFINGSARREKGLTYRLSTKVKEGLKSEGYGVEYIRLVDLNINFCEDALVKVESSASQSIVLRGN